VGDGPDALAGILDVSRETIGRLSDYVALLCKWQRAENLIAPGTTGEIWRRHVADSAQIAALFPKTRRYLDFGSGAGFPGLIVAIVTGADVALVEANQRKCAFLREAIRVTGAPAWVEQGRVEELPEMAWQGIEIVTARAVASLVNLVALATPGLAAGARLAFPKGREFRREIAEASQSWRLDLVIHPSRIDPAGAILEVRRAEKTTAP